MPPAPPVPQEPASALSSPPPADVSTFLAFPSPEKLLRLGPKSSVLIAQQVTAPRLQTSVPRLPRLPHGRDEQGTETGRGEAVRGVGEGCGGFSRNPQMRGRASAPVWAHLGPRKDRPAAPQATRISFFSHVHTHP